jgi:hypothetical protein
MRDARDLGMCVIFGDYSNVEAKFSSFKNSMGHRQAFILQFLFCIDFGMS